MFDDRSTNYDLPLPNLSNPLRVDVERLRTTIGMLDTLLKSIETVANTAMNYKGDWDDAANTPTLPAASAHEVHIQVTSTEGVTVDAAVLRRSSEL